jgi:hypothetical protein
MRKLQKMLAASVLISLPAVFASAQDTQGRPDRQSRQYGNGGNGGDGQFGGQNRRQNGGGFGDNSGNNGDRQFRQRSNFDSGNSSSNNSAPSVSGSTPKVEAGRTPSFVPPVVTGPITFPAQQLPKDYALLLTRSIFSKDHRSVQPDAPKAPVFASASVAALVFKGAMRLDSGPQPYQAQIEDMNNSSKPPTWVSEGELLTSSGARITEITLDHIVVEKNGSRRMITIGVNLDQGEKLPAAATTGSPSGSPAPAPNTGSSPVKIAASSDIAPALETVADQMRRRRQQEMGQ